MTAINRKRPDGICADCGHPGGLHYGPEGVCVADCRSLNPLIQCGCKKFVSQVGSGTDPEGEASGRVGQERVAQASSPSTCNSLSPGLAPEIEQLRNALIKVRAHTSYVNPTIELLAGLLASIERITDAALAVRHAPLAPEIDDLLESIDLSAEGIREENEKSGGDYIYAEAGSIKKMVQRIRAAVQPHAPLAPPTVRDLLYDMLATIPGDEGRQFVQSYLDRLPDAPLAQQWQPIETAPKDGTQVLLWIVGIEPRPRIAYWADRGIDVGWYGLQSQHFIGVNVTHWLPLPLAPHEDEK